MREPALKRVGNLVEFDVDGLCGGTQPSVAVAHISGAAFGIDFAHPDEQVDMRIVRGVRQLDDRVPVHAQIVGEGRAG